ncbi:MAG: endonuclease V [Solitalea-like symbiont of Acarus siro]
MPGYLAFREMPILFKAWEQMQVKPDILMVDGSGIRYLVMHFSVILMLASKFILWPGDI